MLCGRSNMQLCTLMMVVSFGLQVGMISVFCFNMEISSAKKVLTGNGIGYLCLTAYIIWDEINLSEETIPSSNNYLGIIINLDVLCWIKKRFRQI